MPGQRMIGMFMTRSGQGLQVALSGHLWASNALAGSGWKLMSGIRQSTGLRLERIIVESIRSGDCQKCMTSTSCIFVAVGVQVVR
jgi:hypothetical protein